MVADFFTTILQELSKLLQIPNLHPDAYNACLIKFKDLPSVQLELDKSERYLIIGTEISTIPTGRYRENIFTEALRANTQFPRHGIFAYSKQADSLILFEMLPLANLTAVRIAELLPPFLDKARIWRDAIAKGNIPELPTYSTTKSSGLFGLHH